MMPSDTLIGAGRNSPLRVIEESVDTRVRRADEWILLVGRNGRRTTDNDDFQYWLYYVPVLEQQAPLLAGDIDTGERGDRVEAAGSHNQYRKLKITDVQRNARLSKSEDAQHNVPAL
jgi:hypothetical protein